jgi:hypothetical protein
MAPAKAYRRAIRHLGHRFDQFGPIEQANRSCRNKTFMFDCRQWLMDWFRHMGRHGRNGKFRNMRVQREEPRHAPQAEARAQAIDQVREIRILIGRRKTNLQRIETLGHQG